MFRKDNHDSGGYYLGGGNKYLWIWFSDYRKNTVVNKHFQLEIGSKYFNPICLYI